MRKARQYIKLQYEYMMYMQIYEVANICVFAIFMRKCLQILVFGALQYCLVMLGHK